MMRLKKINKYQEDYLIYGLKKKVAKYLLTTYFKNNIASLL